MMKLSWFKGAIALGAVVMIAGVSVPVGVSASTAKQSQTTASQQVSQAKVQAFNQKVAALTPSSIKGQLNKTSNSKLQSESNQGIAKIKQQLSSGKLASSLKSVGLQDVEKVVTTSNLQQAKKVWNTKATNELQTKLQHLTTANGLTTAQLQKLQQTNVAQDIQSVTPAQVTKTLDHLTTQQWQSILTSISTNLGKMVQKIQTPTVDQIRDQSQKITSKQVAAVKQGLQTDGTQSTNYYTDALKNGSQLTLKTNLATSLLGLLLPAVSIAIKLATPLIVGIPTGVFMQVLFVSILAFAYHVAGNVLAVVLSVVIIAIGLIPIVGPFASAYAGTVGLMGFIFAKILAPVFTATVGVGVGTLMGMVLGTVLGTIAGLLAPILRPVLVPPLVTLTRKNDQTITYADALKSGHQYTQAINVQAGHSYQVSLKADQAADIEANDPMTSFGELDYGLVADKTAAIGKSDVSGMVTNVKNGSGSVTSRAQTNYVITFDAQKTGTIYLVADTAKTAVNSRQSKDNYSAIPLWYVNSAIDATLN